MEMKTIIYLTTPYIYEVVPTKEVDSAYQNIKYITLGNIALIEGTSHRVEKDKIIYFTRMSNGMYTTGKDQDKDYIKIKLNKFFKYTNKIYNRKGLLRKINLKEDITISLELLDK